MIIYSWKNLSNYLIITIALLLLSIRCEAIGNVSPPNIGNFTLPLSQQPSPLIGFGQNILAKNETQLFLLVDDYAGNNKYFIDVMPSILYGITDYLSLFISAPYAASYKMGRQKSSGIEDASAQLEYSFYNRSTSTFTDQATLVVNGTVPSGSTQKRPQTGLGSPSFFLGTTLDRTYINWFIFGSPGVVITTTKNDIKYGNSYLYQCGFGRNFKADNGWILAWMTEIDGTYTQKNRVKGVTDPNSGGNVVYVTPSLWASTRRLILQFGIGVPVTQVLYGNQTRETWLLAANVGWSLY